MVDLMLACPRRCMMEEILPDFFPFGNTPALNIWKCLDGAEPFEDDGTGVNVKIYSDMFGNRRRID